MLVCLRIVSLTGRPHQVLAPLPVPAFPEELGAVHAGIRPFASDQAQLCSDPYPTSAAISLGRHPDILSACSGCGIVQAASPGLWRHAALTMDWPSVPVWTLHAALGWPLPIWHAHEGGIAAGLGERAPPVHVGKAAPVAFHALAPVAGEHALRLPGRLPRHPLIALA